MINQTYATIEEEYEMSAIMWATILITSKDHDTRTKDTVALNSRPLYIITQQELGLYEFCAATEGWNGLELATSQNQMNRVMGKALGKTYSID